MGGAWALFIKVTPPKPSALGLGLLDSDKHLFLFGITVKIFLL
jgi:hypothetical protein